MSTNIFILICILLFIYLYTRTEPLAGHLRTDRTLWQLQKKDTWTGWPTNGYQYNATPPPTTWVSGPVGSNPYNYSGVYEPLSATTAHKVYQ